MDLWVQFLVHFSPTKRYRNQSTMKKRISKSEGPDRQGSIRNRCCFAKEGFCGQLVELLNLLRSTEYALVESSLGHFPRHQPTVAGQSKRSARRVSTTKEMEENDDIMPGSSSHHRHNKKTFNCNPFLIAITVISLMVSFLAMHKCERKSIVRKTTAIEHSVLTQGRFLLSWLFTDSPDNS